MVIHIKVEKIENTFIASIVKSEFMFQKEVGLTAMIALGKLLLLIKEADAGKNRVSKIIVEINDF